MMGNSDTGLLFLCHPSEHSAPGVAFSTNVQSSASLDGTVRAYDDNLRTFAPLLSVQFTYIAVNPEW